MSEHEIEKSFPNLQRSGYSITSPATIDYKALLQNSWVKIRKILIYLKEGPPKGISFIPFSAFHPSVK
ncbi:MAG: hypothetical protein GY941_17740 [Planctomycetes bacterium]|nr:hypothetical protein [Planctomycetota bacterium]